MNYKKIYDDLIDNAKNRVLENVYIEEHHIVPRCMKGSNDKDNKIKLLAKEHFIAHLLLCKIYPEEFGLLHAFFRMCNLKKYGTMSCRKYEWVRIKYSKKCREFRKDKTWEDVLGIEIANKAKEKISKTIKEKYKNREIVNSMLGKHHTEKAKKKISEAMEGEKNSNYVILKIEEQNDIIKLYNNGISKEKIGKIYNVSEGKIKKFLENNKIYIRTSSETRKLKEKINCPYCHNAYDYTNYGRWHGDKCLQKPGNEQLNRTNGRLGKTHSEKKKKEMSELAKNREKKECEYCHKLVSPGMYSRWHGEKCKENVI